MTNYRSLILLAVANGLTVTANDANVDPLIRQLTLGHKPTNDARSALGMTACYSHSRMVTRKREIGQVLQLWPDALEFARR